MEAQPQQHEAPAHLQNGLHGLSNGLHLDAHVQQPAVAEQQAHGGVSAADGTALEALPLPAVSAPDAAQEQQQLQQQQQQQQPAALPDQAAHPHLHLLQTAADQPQPAALQLPPPRGLPPAGSYLPYHHHQQQEAPKLLPPLQPSERPAKRQRTADAFVPFALPQESEELSAELRNAKPLPMHERVHYALQLPPLRFADQLQPPGQQYVPVVAHPVGGGGAPILPPPQPSSQLGSTAGPALKKQRAKKPKGAPTRPRSAYMFFLAEFREKFKQDNPEVTKVSDMARHAGEAWRAIQPDKRAEYEKMSADNKAAYAEAIAAFHAANPQPERERPGATPSRRAQTAFALFLADFKRHYKTENPGVAAAAREISQLASNAWGALPPETRQQYETQAEANRAEASHEAQDAEGAAEAVHGGLTAEEAEQLGTLDEAGGPCVIEELPFNSPELAGLPESADVPQVSDASTAQGASHEERISFGQAPNGGDYAAE